MAIVKLDPMLKDLHGKVGDFVFRRGRNGQTIVSRAPQKSRPKSRKAQKALKERNARQQHRMENAHVYARAAMANPEMQAHYQKQARKKKKSAYSLAFGNYFKDPKNKAE